MLVRGEPHKRQSEGKKVANRASAIPPTEEIREATRGLCCRKTLVSVARVECPLLLKTSLPRPASAMEAPPGRIPLSIARSHAGRNHRKVFRQLRAAPAGAIQAFPGPRRNLDDSTAGNSPHIAPVLNPSSVEFAAPGNFADANGILRRPRNHHSGISWTAWPEPQDLRPEGNYFTLS